MKRDSLFFKVAAIAASFALVFAVVLMVRDGAPDVPGGAGGDAASPANAELPAQDVPAPGEAALPGGAAAAVDEGTTNGDEAPSTDTPGADGGARDVESSSNGQYYAVLYADGTLVFQGSSGSSGEHGDVVEEWLLDDAYRPAGFGRAPWEAWRAYIRAVDATCVIRPASMAYWFMDCVYLEKVNFKYYADCLIDASQLTDVSYAFSGCRSLTSIRGLDLETPSLTDMRCIFEGCSALRYVLGLQFWDTSRVTDMNGVFYGCTALTDARNLYWDTSRVTNMSNMFYGCESIVDPSVSGWDTSRVTDMSNMFYGCASLSDPGVSVWDTSKVTNFESLFAGCGALTSIAVSDWKTPNAKNMARMFYNCSALSSLNVSKWDTANVTDMSGMFRGCSSLSSLDLSGFDTSGVADMADMFRDCSSLETVFASPMFSTSSLERSSNMFRGLIIGTTIWKEAGWGTIIYLASLSSINPELYEAATVDGANRFQKVWHISLTGIASTISIQLILQCGSIMNNGFEQIYMFQNPLNIRTSEVFETYIYKVGLLNTDFSYSTAVGLFKSVVNLIFVFIANRGASMLGQATFY